MAADPYLFAICPATGRDLDLGQLRAYAIADAQARFRRARGEDVLLAVALEGSRGEGEAPAGAAEPAAAGPAPPRRRLDELGISADWERSLALDDPLVGRWSESLLERLRAAGLVYERGGTPFLRTSDFDAENDRRLDQLDGWTDAARAAQRALLCRVDGVELEGQALDGTPLTLFTSHGDAIGDAEFVGLSPQRPEIDRWLEEGSEAASGVDVADLRQRIAKLRTGDWEGRPVEELPVVEIGISAQVPGVPQPLPILVSPSIDARFGPAATIGVPSVDSADKALARDLPKLGGLAWKTDAKPPKTSPAVRYLAHDMPLSDAGASAGRRFVAAWIELALAVPPEQREDALSDASALAGRLPVTQAVAAPDSASALLDMRTVAKALREAGALDLPGGEPLGPTLLCAPLALGDTAVDELIATHGADAVRFALLYAAAPEKEYAGGDSVVRHCAAVLAELRAFAEPRLAGAAGSEPAGAATPNGAAPAAGDAGGAEPPPLDARIEAGDGLRRRLADWCDTAVERAGENYERLDMHRATRNAIELSMRIQDFERRVIEHRGEVAGADREASAIALAVLARLLAPLAPTLAHDLWRAAGHPGAVADARWPARQREHATA
ncbi:MAG: class I tRNA ligase family protein [Thermoleophilaceae bacterium]